MVTAYVRTRVTTNDFTVYEMDAEPNAPDSKITVTLPFNPDLPGSKQAWLVKLKVKHAKYLTPKFMHGISSVMGNKPFYVTQAKKFENVGDDEETELNVLTEDVEEIVLVHNRREDVERIAGLPPQSLTTLKPVRGCYAHTNPYTDDYANMHCGACKQCL